MQGKKSLFTLRFFQRCLRTETFDRVESQLKASSIPYSSHEAEIVKPDHSFRTFDSLPISSLKTLEKTDLSAEKTGQPLDRSSILPFE